MPTADDRASKLDRAYGDVLLRPPTARERRKWTARLPAPLLRWRLRRTPEFLRGVAPFLASASMTLCEIGGGAVAAEVAQLHDRWRQVLAGAPARWGGFTSPVRTLVEERGREVDALFEEALMRAPDPVTRRQFVARWSLGLDDGESLRSELVASTEHAGVARFRVAVRDWLGRLALADGVTATDIAANDLPHLYDRWQRTAADERRHERALQPLLADIVRERFRAVDALFGELLMRPADDATRRRFVARWSLGLDDLESLRRELIVGEEHALLARFRGDVSAWMTRLAALDGSDPAEIEAADMRHLFERWRGAHTGALDRWTTRETPSPKMLAERARAVDVLFAEVLARPPDAESRRRFVARWSLGLDDLESLRRDLVACDEHARLARLGPAKLALLRQLASLGDGEGDETDEPGEAAEGGDIGEPEVIGDAGVRRLHERWTRAFADAHAAWPDGGPPPIELFEARIRALDALFAEVLLRPPSARARQSWLARWLLGLDDLRSIRVDLEATSEYLTVVSPLVATVREVHQRYVHRPPSPGEIQDAVDRARTSLRTRADLVAALADGSVRRKLGIRPLKLEMDVTTQCNLRCTMCYFSDPRYGKRERVDVTVEDFRRLAREVFPHCGLVSLSFGTEPLLHPELGEMLEIVAEEEVSWRYLITNGLLLDERLIETFVRVPLHGFSVSIDAATAGTYERIRRGGRWEKLMSNLRALQAAKRRAGSDYPRITFNFVMMRSNLDELPALIRLAHELGAEGVSATHLTSFEGLDVESELLHTERERCNAVLEETRAEAARLGIPVALPEPFEIEASSPRVLKESSPPGFLFPSAARADAPCPFPWQFIGIDPYGKVVPCGWWYTEPPMGDVHEQSLVDIWESPAWQELRREHATGSLRPLCLSCPAAGMGSCENPRAFDTVTLGLAHGTEHRT